MSKRIAIITGASSGMGPIYAREIDKRQDVDEIWLIARSRTALDEVKSQLKYSKGRVLAYDLTDHETMRGIEETLRDDEPEVKWLINNAGFGAVGRFEGTNIHNQLDMIKLNVEVVTELTHLVLPFCKKGSRIIQVASVAAFFPIKDWAVYAATKSYVLSFSNALYGELKEKGITVTALCPGPMRTKFFETSGSTKEQTSNLMFMYDPEKVVLRSMKDCVKGKMISTYGGLMKTLIFSGRLICRKLQVTLSSLFFISDEK